MYYLGIDLGTSAVKIVCMDEKGTILRTVSREYKMYFPHPDWSEQEPSDWWNAVVDGCKEILSYVEIRKVKGISFAGQMHGLVILDEYDQVIRPAILWNDGRSIEECVYLNDKIGRKNLSAWCANIAFAGFTAPKLLWLKKHEPDNFQRIQKIMMPKDYIAYHFSGICSTDVSDASGTLFFDVAHKCWSKELLDICAIRKDQLPEIYESYKVTGNILPAVADEIGLMHDVKIIAGAGDNAAAAIGTGTIGEGACNISLGTSGTIFISSKNFTVDNHNALHSFAHADGSYHLLGCMLSAASCNKWWMNDILHIQDYAKEQEKLNQKGRNNVYFLPYLMGERSPHNDQYARGAFINLTMNTTREDMTQAVLEGVCFALRDSLEIAKTLGIKIEKSKICGGGAKSPYWRKLLANILNIDIEIPYVEECSGFGAAILAATGCGEFHTVKDACENLINVTSVIHPVPLSVQHYEERYQKFRKLYPLLKQTFQELNKEEII